MNIVKNDHLMPTEVITNVDCGFYLIYYFEHIINNHILLVLPQIMIKDILVTQVLY